MSIESAFSSGRVSPESFFVDPSGFAPVALTLNSVFANHNTAKREIPDDYPPNYRNAFATRFGEIEVSGLALQEMALLNSIGMGSVKMMQWDVGQTMAMTKWGTDPKFKNFAKWYTDVFEPRFNEMLKAHPDGIFIKDMSMSPKDVLVEVFSKKAREKAEEVAREKYPYLDSVDKETVELLRDQIYFEMCSLKSAKEAIEYLLCSARVATTLGETLAQGHPYFVLIRPFDKQIVRACEKRMAVLKEGGMNSEPKVMAFSSYATSENRADRQELPQNHWYPQAMLKKAQKFITDNQNVLFSLATKRTVVDLFIYINTNLFAAAVGLLQSTKDIPPQLIERNPYDEKPASAYPFMVDRHITDLVINLMRPKAKETGSSVSPIMEALQGYVGAPPSVADINRFWWDEPFLWAKDMLAQVRVDIRDYWADYAVGCNERKVTPVPFIDFERIYFATGQKHETEDDELAFFKKIYEEEKRHLHLANEAQAKQTAAKATAAAPATASAVAAPSSTWIEACRTAAASIRYIASSTTAAAPKPNDNSTWFYTGSANTVTTAGAIPADGSTWVDSTSVSTGLEGASGQLGFALPSFGSVGTI